MSTPRANGLAAADEGTEPCPRSPRTILQPGESLPPPEELCGREWHIGDPHSKYRFMRCGWRRGGAGLGLRRRRRRQFHRRLLALVRAPLLVGCRLVLKQRCSSQTVTQCNVHACWQPRPAAGASSAAAEVLCCGACACARLCIHPPSAACCPTFLPQSARHRCAKGTAQSAAV